MRQSCAKTLVTEEPDEGNLHVRLCGGSTWVTGAFTRTICILKFVQISVYGTLCCEFSYVVSI